MLLMTNLQSNAITGKPYEGRNQVELLRAKEAGKFGSDEWVTFLQARELSRKIVKGSHGVGVFKGYRTFEVTDEKGKLKTESRPAGWATVFNLDQTEKYETVQES